MDDSPFHGPMFDDLVARGVIKIGPAPDLGSPNPRLDAPLGPLTDLERAWLKRAERALHREVVAPTDRPMPTSDKVLFGLMCAVVVMALAALPIALVVHELAAHGWIDRVGR
jgi:hypothetical protein